VGFEIVPEGQDALRTAGGTPGLKIGIGGRVAPSPLPHHQDMRVRIRRFSSVKLKHRKQPWNPERVEVDNGQG
jgi:hypothetical protein